MLSQLAAGSRIDLLGALGNGFAPPTPGENPVLLAGGIGLGPILFLRDHLLESGARPLFLYGARSSAFVPRGRLPSGCQTCSDDGSVGFKGTVLDCLLAQGCPERAALYACGPGPMLKALAAFAERRSFPCQVAVEQRMACGVGACMGCTVAVNDERKFARACVEGPVFRAEELSWE
jgi:dihydroorotate dehydrogenase electron transfer subunit